MTTAWPIPIIHRNGTSRDVLLTQRSDFGAALRAALVALADMAPNGRDFYPEPGRLERALAVHRKREMVLREMLSYVQDEAEAIADASPGGC